jgi:protein SCO1
MSTSKFQFKDFYIKSLLVLCLSIAPIFIAFFYNNEKTFSQNETQLSNKFLRHFNKKYTLVYIGYTGCINICTPRLFEVSNLQRALDIKKYGSNLEFMFLDIRTLGDGTTKDFLKAFDAKIDVLSLDDKAKQEIIRELNFYFARSLSDSNEFEHTSYMYLIEKRENEVFHIATIMQYPFDKKSTIEFIKNKVSDDYTKN